MPPRRDAPASCRPASNRVRTIGSPAGDLFPGLLSTAGFDELAVRYRKQTGFALCAIEPDGHVLRGHPTGSCSQAESCRPYRAQAVAEALRWGEPCVLCCACGRAMWAVPVMRNQHLCGGLLVSGVALAVPRKAGNLDRRLLSASGRLVKLAVELNLANAALMAERRHSALVERDRAEALHVLKDRLLDADMHTLYRQHEPALLAAIRRGEKKEARRILTIVLTAAYGTAGRHTPLLKSLALELVVMMTRAAVQAGANPEKILGLNYQSLAALAKITNQENLSAWLCSMLDQLIDAIEAHGNSPTSVLLTKAVDYISRHLAEDITRDEAARAAGLSPSRFSHLMRERTGWTFSELLTRLRIDHACHLLAHTESDLVDVALACGFADQSYFNRVFRKRVHQTPREYRAARRVSAPKFQSTARESKA